MAAASKPGKPLLLPHGACSMAICKRWCASIACTQAAGRPLAAWHSENPKGAGMSRSGAPPRPHTSAGMEAPH